MSVLSQLLSTINDLRVEFNNAKETFEKRNAEDKKIVEDIINDQKTEITNIGNELNTQENINTNLTTNLSTKQTTNEQLNKKNTQLTDTNDKLTRKNTQLSTTNTQLTNKNKQLTNKNSQLSNKNSQLNIDNLKLDNQNTCLSNDIVNKTKEIGEKNSIIEQKVSIINEKLEKMDALETTFQEIDNKNQIMKRNQDLLNDEGNYYKVEILRTDFSSDQSNYCIETARKYIQYYSSCKYTSGFQDCADAIVSRLQSAFGGYWHCRIMLKMNYDHQGTHDDYYFIKFTMGEYVVTIKRRDYH